MHALDMYTVAKGEFIQSLQEKILLPRKLDYRVQFCGPTGTNAVEAALKIARKVKGRQNIFAFQGGFHGMTLGSLKEIVRRCDLMVTNDTGPRHIAAAMDVPVVTVFGPTHPEWTEIYFEKERKVAVKVFCGPCQKKVCPLDHRCMTRVTPGMVFDTALELLGRAPRATALPQAPTAVL